MKERCPPNTTLDTYFPEDSPHRIRVEDVFGDKGTVVGYHDGIVMEGHFQNCPPWFWVKRDRDGATVGINKKMIK
jgi:hypothetical protein